MRPGLKLALALFLMTPFPGVAKPGSPPQFSALTAQGEPLSSKSTRRKVVILTWWAHWCAPCKEELQDFDRLHRAYRSRGVVVIALDADMRDPHYRFRSPDPSSSLLFADSFNGSAFPLQGVPTTYVIDRTGRIAGTFHGKMTLSEMETTITPLL